MDYLVIYHTFSFTQLGTSLCYDIRHFIHYWNNMKKKKKEKKKEESWTKKELAKASEHINCLKPLLLMINRMG